MRKWAKFLHLICDKSTKDVLSSDLNGVGELHRWRDSRLHLHEDTDLFPVLVLGYPIRRQHRGGAWVRTVSAPIQPALPEAIHWGAQRVGSLVRATASHSLSHADNSLVQTGVDTAVLLYSQWLRPGTTGGDTWRAYAMQIAIERASS